MPSNHLILCHPLLLLPSIFPSNRVFSSESPVCIRWPKYWSFNFNISPSNEYSGLMSFRMDWLDLLAVRGTLRNLLQPQFKRNQKKQLNTYMYTYLRDETAESWGAALPQACQAHSLLRPSACRLLSHLWLPCPLQIFISLIFPMAFTTNGTYFTSFWFCVLPPAKIQAPRSQGFVWLGHEWASNHLAQGWPLPGYSVQMA